MISQSPRRVLIVDDERTIADTLSQIFCLNGFEARSAYSAEGATEILAEWAPNLIIIDVILPGMNGVDFAIVVRGQFPDCRVLLFSGVAATGKLLLTAAREGHKFDILAKPVHPREMLEEAKRLLNLSNESPTNVSELIEKSPVEPEVAPD